ncbi:hypothetical protein O6H91_20G070100 [Diphasiastrum complanatum]|uniref:Uncharacterized protein n=5 Tax=Diphasiastrum complanatum TaxID=34168 RepID=A0ACC2ARL3_DIPCM|nr:hypothetical protein O6H91_20G070100 [Diphasiastrum complanatum]KAJ7520162.1 hypothetical protein O6H91_20G070100 [Diphasiastrum complanatum]KAJ7520163.1 hypothetical protein O6H91_20G070100 [Diphasiastrum complanatum]KAJ7520164.1 hypothetical protein O6H91_20G070100 [Diphasiastrum complanatum]KAJ7520165.1 hypothetical protein O6H91_20G070100 [Diphasiastrum complanatum]
MEMEDDLYKILGLTPGLEGGTEAKPADVRRAYRARALLCHPDKRPDDPVAASEFARLQQAYEVLYDEKARRTYDELLLLKKARLEKESQQSTKRRKMMQDLRAREYAFEMQQKERAAEDLAATRLQAEIARIRASQAKNSAGFQSAEAYSCPPSNPNRAATRGSLEASDIDKTIKVSWNSFEGVGGYSATRLREIFEEFGPVEDIVIKQGKNQKKGTALLVMGSKNAAVAATQTQCGDLPSPLLVVPAVPLSEAVYNAHQRHQRVIGQQTVQDAGLQTLVGSIYRSYEDLTMRKMRQAAERAKLIKEMQEDEAKGVQ